MFKVEILTRLFLIKPVALAVGLVFSASAWAENGVETTDKHQSALGSTCLACNAEKLQASVQTASEPVLQTSGEGELEPDATRIVADEVRGQTNVEANARGNVIVERNQQTLNADWVHYDQTTDTVTAGDQFILDNDGNQIHGKDLQYRLSDGIGKATDLKLEAEHEGRRFQAVSQEAELLGKNRYQLKDVQFNTCQKGDASWYIRASSIDADYDKGVGVAKNARLVFGGVPVLYTPWVDFPLNGNRKSGLLVPTLKVGSDGTEIDLPYYFNLAPNYDATLSVGAITARGVRAKGEFRYLQPKYQGVVSGTWMPNDKRSTQNNRYQAQWQHQHRFSKTLSGGINFNQVSDDDYYRDFYGRADIATNVNLDRSIWLDHHTRIFDGALDSRLFIQDHQTLANSNGYKDEPYAIKPRLSTHWQKNLGDAQFNIEGQFTRFQHDSKQSGERYVLYPSVSQNFHNSWGYIRPKLGLHYTYYDLDQFSGKQSRRLSRVLPISNIDAGLTFERQTSLFGKDYVQTLEPRLFYNYIPTKTQNDLPDFDASENSFSYQQLFRENLYSGNDRINSANSLSTAVQTRYLDRQTGEERFRAGIGQKFYFKTDNVLLDGSISNHERNRSDWIAFADGKITDSISAYTTLHYNANRSQMENVAAGVSYHPEAGKVLSLRYKFGRNEPIYLESNGSYYFDRLNQIDLAAQWPLSKNLYAVARFNYELTVKKPLEQLVGLEYKSDCGCWSASFTAQRYVTGWDKNRQSTYKNAFFLTLQLKDLSNIGQPANEQLRLAIPHYVKTNEIVKK